MYGKLEIGKSGFKLYGEKFYLASGDIHYFRIHPSSWENVLDLAVDFGLTAIQTYVPWHLHEKKQGHFDFWGQDGELNLKGFLELCDKKGLKVLLRPSPYICSECDMGGLPAWLIKRGREIYRCCDADYINAVENYYKRLCAEFLPYLSTNGGPIIAVALENEYGGYGNEEGYLLKLRELLSENGVDVPFYTTDTFDSLMLVNGSVDGCLCGFNFRSTPSETEKALELLGKLKPEQPLFVGEFWCGRSQMWGEKYSPRDPRETAEAYKTALNMGAYVNFYMFAGGTNFGFTSGSLYGAPFTPDKEKNYPRFLPYTTSYDVDALIGEDGNPTKKYFLCRDILDEYLGKSKRSHLIAPKKAQEFTVKLTEAASLFDNLENIGGEVRTTVLPLSMEELGQEFGYVLYETRLNGSESWTRLRLVNSVRDRASIYLNGEYKGTYTRDGGNEPIEFTVPKSGIKLGLLVENLGRCCNAAVLGEIKGLVSPEITVNLKNSFNWKQTSIPLNNLNAIEYKSNFRKEKLLNYPVFLKGEFEAEAGIDTFISTEGFTHGNIWVNGFNIGRYWNAGPQKTLLVSGGLLKDKGNIIEIFDTEYGGKTEIKFLSKNLLY